MNLKALNSAERCEDGSTPVLQYVALLDIGSISVQTVVRLNNMVIMISEIHNS